MWARVGLIALCVACICGCGSRAQRSAPNSQSRADAHAEWPENTLLAPEFLSTVDRQAGVVRGDAEPSRIPSTYQIPDWAEPTSTISAKGPKGGKMTFHLLPRVESLRKQDDQHIALLLKGQKRAAEELVVARPWIGWFGQGTGVEAKSSTESRPYTLRVYTLFDGDRQLEVHIQWPTGNKEAFEEAEALLTHVVYSVEPLKSR